MSIAARLQALGIELPPLAIPAAAYLPFVQSGALVFLSGHIAKKDGKPWVGQLGLTMTTEEGKAAARAIAIDLMGTLQAAAGGDLARVKRIVKVMSLVNSTATFTEQHLVTNGCSELLGEIFGDAGKLASGLLDHFIAQGWLRRIGSERALEMTPPGRLALWQLLGAA